MRKVRVALLFVVAIGLVSQSCGGSNQIEPPFSSIVPECETITASTVSYAVPEFSSSAESSDGDARAQRVCKGSISCPDCGDFTLSIKILAYASASAASAEVRQQQAALPDMTSHDSNHQFDSMIEESPLNDARVGATLFFSFDGWDLNDNLRDDDSAPAFEDWMGFEGSRLVFNVENRVVTLEARARSQIIFILELGGFLPDVDASIPDDFLPSIADRLLSRWHSLSEATSTD
jgi:hypothetical protein